MEKRNNFIIFGTGLLARHIAEQLIVQLGAYVVMVDSVEENLASVFHEPSLKGEKYDFLRKYTVASFNRGGLNLAYCDIISTPDETEEEDRKKRGRFFRWINSVANSTRIGKFDKILFLEQDEQGLPLSAGDIDLWLLVAEPHLEKVLAPGGKTIIFGTSNHPYQDCPLNVLHIDDCGSEEKTKEEILGTVTAE